MSDVEHTELAPGYSISRIINGCWQLTPDHGGGPATESETHRIFAELVDHGFTTFDCADIYVGVEESLGRFRKNLAAPDSVQIHSKYAPDRDTLHELTAPKIKDAVNRSLSRLGVERLDLLQFHWWRYELPGHMEMLETLMDLRDAGKIRLLGVTNYDTAHLAELLQRAPDLASIQCQYSLLDRRPQRHMAKLCEENDVHILPYGVLAGGFLSEKYLDVPAPDVTNRSLTKYRLIIDEAGSWATFQHLLRTLAGIGERHGVPASAIAARWTLDQPAVAAIMLGVGTKSRAAQNRAISGIRLTQQDRDDIKAALSRMSIPPGDVYELERDFSGPHTRIIKMNLHDSQQRD
ncbi:MAG: aldo/keto reductase [Gammaproteobacteria bacterium]|nr:aldo/keto reductase [Gammaproteobacteria bacterium]